MNTRLSILLLSALLGLAACSTDDNPDNNPETTDTSAYSEPDYNAVKCDVPVFVSASIKTEVRTALESYLTSITSLDEAEVAVVKGEDIGTYEGRLMDLYERGGLVVVARPRASTSRPSPTATASSTHCPSTHRSPCCSSPPIRPASV